jgi:hypothetical protein
LQNTINVRARKDLKKNVAGTIIIVTIAAGFLLLSAATTTNEAAYTQSGAATKQQPSQSSQPQVGQVFTFNEKSLPPNAPQLCASLASCLEH